jgi:hypothetical protein
MMQHPHPRLGGEFHIKIAAGKAEADVGLPEIIEHPMRMQKHHQQKSGCCGNADAQAFCMIASAPNDCTQD